MAEQGNPGAGGEHTSLPKGERDDEGVLKHSKLGGEADNHASGKSHEDALSEAKLGDENDGGRKGQGGMRDPTKTSDDGKFRPS